MNQRHNRVMAETAAPKASGDTAGNEKPEFDIWNILGQGGTYPEQNTAAQTTCSPRGPLGPLTVPVIISIIKKVYDILFGESEEDRKNRQMEAAVRAEREAAERRAREMARYEEELKQYCQALAMEFRNEAKRNFRQSLSSLMEPLFQQIRDEFKKQTQIGEQVLSDVNKLGEIMSSFEIIRADLKTSAI